MNYSVAKISVEGLDNMMQLLVRCVVRQRPAQVADTLVEPDGSGGWVFTPLTNPACLG